MQDTVNRWSAQGKHYLNISRKEAVKIYNECMGGVDDLDFLISLFLFSFFTSLFLQANTWIEYRDNIELIRHHK